MKNIRWTAHAKHSLKSILEYWTSRNASDQYSQKLLELFDEATQKIALMPGLGKQSDVPFARMKLVRDYWIIYSESAEEIIILEVGSTRQHPGSLYKHLK